MLDQQYEDTLLARALHLTQLLLITLINFYIVPGNIELCVDSAFPICPAAMA